MTITYEPPVDSYGKTLPQNGLPDAKVPCGTCKLCCKNSAVLMMPISGDVAENYDTIPFPLNTEFRILRIKDNGDCTYLGENGCTIYDRRPYMCRIYDCRAQSQMYTRKERKQLVKEKSMDPAILKRGAILIHQAAKQLKKESE